MSIKFLLKSFASKLRIAESNFILGGPLNKGIIKISYPLQKFLSRCANNLVR